MKLSTSNGLAAGSIDVTAVACTPPKIVDASVEHAVIIIKNGNIYHCNGDVHGIPKVYFDNMASELEGAHITHNHPIGADENEHTFSDDDIKLFKRFNLARLRGIDGKFLFELNRNETNNELAGKYEIVSAILCK